MSYMQMQTNAAMSAVFCTMMVACYGNSGTGIRFTSLRNADVENCDLALPEGNVYISDSMRYCDPAG